MNTTVIHYNTNTPSGRAITHVLDKSGLMASPLGDGLELREHDDGGRTLIVHPSFSGRCSKGEASILLVVESLAGQGNVNLLWLLDDIDQHCKRAIGEAVLIAGGFRGATMVTVP